MAHCMITSGAPNPSNNKRKGESAYRKKKEEKYNEKLDNSRLEISFTYIFTDVIVLCASISHL